VSVADSKNKLPELIKAPRLGTLKGRIMINDPDWWKPMSEEEVAAFLEGRY
jgi:hypothetical protein